jgi:pyruvate ferredoxin oxidoreductase gamma subunit
VLAVPASQLAQEHVGRPLPNAALLGGFAALTGLIRFASVAAAIEGKFSGRIASSNVAAARAAYEQVENSGRGATTTC